MEFWLQIISAYLLGSFSFAIFLSKRYGRVDPREQGSGNPGATNMLRVAGRQLAILTLIGDIAKGLVPILVAKYLNQSPQQQAWIGLAAVLGHLYPLYHQFKGGKGISTGAGMLLGLYPPAFLIAIAAWLLAFALTRTSSAAAMATLPLSLPMLAWQEPTALVPVSILSMLLIWRHRQNVKDLWYGRERHF